MKRLLLSLMMLYWAMLSFAQAEPDWVHIQLPKPSAGNDTYFYQVISIDNAVSLTDAQELANKKAREAGIQYKRNWINVQTLESTEDEMFVGINLACPPYKETKNGTTTYYFLYQISKGGDMPRYETCDCNSRDVQQGVISQEKDLRSQAIRHIQTRAIPASVFVPGVGQIVKGQYLKGGLMLGSEVVGVAGIITSFSMKSSYERLIKQDAKHATIYAQNADMWQNVSYGFIGLAAAVYVYSLIDVIATRPTDAAINKAMENIAFAPVYSPDNGSIGLAMQVKF